MKKFSIFSFVLLTLGIGLLFSSCKTKDDPVNPKIEGDALFTYIADGLKVTFTNTSTVPGTYLWDFGDSETATDKNPVHTYATKGEYTVKLTVKDANGDNHDVSTKINVDKATRIDLTDNSFDDWNKVTEPEFTVALGDNSGIVNSVVFDYDADYVYMKMNYTGSLVDTMIFDIFIDTDNEKTTGFNSGLWTGAGLDVLLEGAVLHQLFDLFDYSGAANGWGWTVNAETAFYTLGHVEESNGTVTFEIAYKRSKVPGLSGDEAKFCIQIQTILWAGVGWAPDQFVTGGDDTDGFLLEMK